MKINSSFDDNIKYFTQGTPYITRFIDRLTSMKILLPENEHNLFPDVSI